MSLLETKLFKKYPRVAPIAEILGFSVDDIEILMNKMRSNLECNSYFKTDVAKQVALQAILIRIDLNKEEFFKHIHDVKHKGMNDEELSKECGRSNLKAYKAILQ
ncbi:hypothetical protein [Bacillus smithii]|uniref:hypothetical protein n=1 Tax=Bacillus smithii TaxID=1479 RepID=UPI003D218D01